MRSTIYIDDKLHQVMTLYTKSHKSNNSELISRLLEDYLSNPFNWNNQTMYEALITLKEDGDNE